jgi:para-aminobenzoate synthetase component I
MERVWNLEPNGWFKSNPAEPMPAIVAQALDVPSPETLVNQLAGEAGVVLLRSHHDTYPQARFSFVTARPFLTFRSRGSRCELVRDGSCQTVFGNPWLILDDFLNRFALRDARDLPFPLGGCFGYWGYELKYFVEPKLRPIATDDLGLPDCQVGFYDSLVAFDHAGNQTWIVSTGLNHDGSRDETRARHCLDFWQDKLKSGVAEAAPAFRPAPGRNHRVSTRRASTLREASGMPVPLAARSAVKSNLTRSEFLSKVEYAQRYILAGDIYQVNLSQRLAIDHPDSGWEFFRQLTEASPAPFAAYLDCADFQLASSSPELFLRLSGSHILTHPIKGTRPRSADPISDAQLAWELQTSPKETAELVMITDLLRNDLGRFCAYGSVLASNLLRLERYAQVQHLVSTIEGRLRPEVSHVQALAGCFPGGSVTGAPKVRAMEIIEELEPVRRGPYTGCLGYLGFNRESQLSIIIRTALCMGSAKFFQVGAGIVADSDPAAEYEETLDKAQGFLDTASPGGSGGVLAAMPDPPKKTRTPSRRASKTTPCSPTRWVFFDGQLVPECEAKVSVFDRSFRYGDGLFETLRVYGGRPFAWEQHLDRLRRGAEFLRIRLPFDAAELRCATLELVRRNQMPEAVLRIHLSRGSGRRGYAPAGDESPLLVMSLGEAPAVAEATPPRWRLITSSQRLPMNDLLSAFKTCCQLAHVLACAEARERGAQDALLLNAVGNVVETTSANLFWIQDDLVCTPPLSSGALPGITRAWVIGVCSTLGVKSCERNISGAGLLRTDGVFLTQSVSEIVEVSHVDAIPMRPSDFTKTVRQAYRKECLGAVG